MRLAKYRIDLTEQKKSELKRIVRQHSAAQRIVKRTYIILLVNGGTLANQAITDQVWVYPCDITRWTKRQGEPVKCHLRDTPRS